jgi:hypothetical protein
MIAEVILRVNDGAVNITGWGAFLWIVTLISLTTAIREGHKK